MMFWVKSFQFILNFTVRFKKKKEKKLVLQAPTYGKNSSSKNKPFLLKLEPEAQGISSLEP